MDKLTRAAKILQCSSIIVLCASNADASSLELYGQVNKTVVGYSDGVSQEVAFVDNNVSSTRFGLRKTVDVDYGLTASVLYEGQLNNTSNSRNISQPLSGVAPADPAPAEARVRHARVGLSNHLGVLFIGHTSSASDGITEIDLGAVRDVLGPTPARFGARLQFTNPDGSLSGLRMQQVVDAFEGVQFAGGSASDGTNAFGAGFTDRFNQVHYVSPTVGGLSFSTATIQGGDRDYALRYKNTFKTLGFKVEAGIAMVDYRQLAPAAAGTNKVGEQFSGSASVLFDSGHSTTVAYGRREYKQRAAGIGLPQFYYIKQGYAWGGWEVAAEHGHYQNIDTTTPANTTLYSYGLGLQRGLGHGVSAAAFGRLLDLDRTGTPTQPLYIYGLNLRVRF